MAITGVEICGPVPWVQQGGGGGVGVQHGGGGDGGVGPGCCALAALVAIRLAATLANINAYRDETRMAISGLIQTSPCKVGTDWPARCPETVWQGVCKPAAQHPDGGCLDA